MEKVNLVYFHIGNVYPYILIENIYQSCLIHTKFSEKHQANLNIYVLTNGHFLEDLRFQINQLAIEDCFKKCIILIPVECLNSDSILHFEELYKTNSKYDSNFNDGFWVSSTSRFFYLESFMRLFKIKNVFHIENDVLLYTNLHHLYLKMKTANMVDKLVTVQDSDDRAICSVVYVPDADQLKEFLTFVVDNITVNDNYNDMVFMGKYKNKYEFPDSPDHPLAEDFGGVIDGCCFGQFIGGTDPRFIQSDKFKTPFVNPNIGFINETSRFKPNQSELMSAFLDRNDGYTGVRYFAKTKGSMLQLKALHIHSKQLYLHSSLFNLEYSDIISGDKIIQGSDLVLIAADRYNGPYMDLLKWNSAVYTISDFTNVNMNVLNNDIIDIANKKNSLFIKIHVVSCCLKEFQNHILDKLDNRLKYIIYSHNSDENFDDTYNKLINSPVVHKVYAQNISIAVNDKVSLLPIGIARSIWPHGDLKTLYSVIASNYWKRKTHGLYINIDESTYPYRRQIMNIIREKPDSFKFCSERMPYKQYLQELSKHRFAFCIRGNGLDTHRFWESLYLGVIPVIIDDGTITNYKSYLEHHNIPHCVITSEFFKMYTDSYFTDELYNKVLHQYNIKNGIVSLNVLKMKNYI